MGGAGAFFLRPKLLRQPWGTTASEAGEATSSELQASILIRAGLHPVY